MGKTKTKNADAAAAKENTPPSSAAAAAAAAAPVKPAVDLNDVSALEARIKNHAAYFDGLLSFIAPRFYMPSDEPNVPNNKYIQNAKGKAPKQEVKESSKKAKKAKFEPKKTVPEIQAELAEQQKAEKMEEGSDEEDGEEAETRSKKTIKPVTSIIQTATHSELQEKLRMKIDQLRGRRRLPDGTEDRPRRDKKSRKDIKERNLARAPMGKGLPSEAHEGDGDAAADKPAVIFSKFDFGAAERSKAKPKAKPTPQQLLAKAEAAQQRIEKLSQEDASKAKEAIEKDKWHKAMAKAEGQKIFDDPKLVKKTIKKIEKQKLKSAKDWGIRKKETNKAIKERIDKREANIKARSEDKKNRKMGKGGKKSPSAKKKRPGFEGGGAPKKA